MGRGLGLLLTVLTGGMVALQAPINHSLKNVTGPFQAAVLSFAIGLVALLGIMMLFGGGVGPLSGAAHVPWYYLTGGILGAIYVTTILVTVKTLGVGGITAATLTGQIAVSLIADRLGILGLPQVQITWHRIMGFALLAVGTWLVLRR